MDEKIGMALNPEYFDNENEMDELSDEIAMIHIAIGHIPTTTKIDFIKQN
jgi:hypothetical protein|tara:strand:+ start:249 stop:398 length:150 start_codon:yes stop_codon:yes gene_type:complete